MGMLNGLAEPQRTRMTVIDTGPVPGLAFIQKLLNTSLMLAEDWDEVPAPVRDELVACADPRWVLPRLVELRLLTTYQAMRVEAGKTFGLVLGNYRVLDRLGAGGMGVVFKGEHLLMRRPVAIKVLALSYDHPVALVRRFYAEMRAIAQLQHPNIVGAMEGGKVASADEDGQELHYFVMEYVPGRDLEQLVKSDGPLAPAAACDLAYQVASALAEADRHHLVHRDIKPSNILVTPEGHAKLLDFGLARHFRHRMTEAGTMLGTLDYMAPEQAQDAGAVDIRADIYGLGGLLFWCLTGRTPFEWKENVVEQVLHRITQPPPSVREFRPDVTEGLDELIGRMMAVDPEDRFANPQAVMRALLPFLKPELRDHHLLGEGDTVRTERRLGKEHQILVVDDEPNIRLFCRYALEVEGCKCDEAGNGAEALVMARQKTYDLILLDIDMPVLSGGEACRQLRAAPPGPHVKIIMFSGRATGDEMAQIMMTGADDYLAKPLSVTQLRARVKAALRLKDAQERSDLLNQHLLRVNSELETNLSARDSDLVQARNALVLGLAKLVSFRDSETGAHLLRLQRFSRCLAEEAAHSPSFAATLDNHFIEMLECCAPLHDIGKVGLPDHILMKPGKLTPDERMLMQTHTTIGAETLQEVAKQRGFALAFLQMAADIARHHHERFDGQGYPDRLAGTAIPLAARIVSIVDVYDALRSRRIYKPALSHAAALQVMLEGCTGQFDPALLQVFQRCAHRFEEIFRDLQG